MKFSNSIVCCVFLLISFTAHAGVHSVESSRPLYLEDPVEPWVVNPVRGNALISWKDHSLDAFANVLTYVQHPFLPVIYRYQFELVSVRSSDSSSITGVWNVYKNRGIACRNCPGTAYGLDLPVGEYFKIYVDDPTGTVNRQWHYSGFIDHRFDY